MMAEWIIDGHPSLDLWPLDMRRFALPPHDPPLHVSARGRALRSPLQAEGTRVTSTRRRGVRRSPLHDELSAAGSLRFARRLGAAELVRAEGVEAEDRRRSPDRTGSTTSAPRRTAVRGARGTDRSDLLRQVRDHRPWRAGCGAVAVRRRHGQAEIGSVTYTQLCNERGGIECDLTMARTADVVVRRHPGSAFGAHDMGWIRANSPTDGSVPCCVT